MNLTKSNARMASLDLKKIKDTLPNTLHELLGLALDDFERMSKDNPSDMMYMLDWYQKDKSGVCSV